jgi:phosphoribosylformimino-5-aminoimidazole carboxamide ribotide isomerase
MLKRQGDAAAAGTIDLRAGLAIPAIDLLGGQVVRLRQGRYERATAYSDDPYALAHHYADCGAEWLHVVDLDAARTGRRPHGHARVLEAIASIPGLRLQLGGGLRDEPGVRAALAGGADRVLVATLAAADPDLVGGLAAETGRVAVALDCLAGRVRTHGWLADGGADPAAFVRRLGAAGVRDYLVTGIDRDGTGRGPDLDLIRGLRAGVSGLLLAAGGVGSPLDVHAALAAGADAVVVGRAMLDGTLTYA